MKTQPYLVVVRGGLRYFVYKYGKGFPWVVVTIWGDLRDYSDIDEIEKWWNETLQKFRSIRDCCLRVEVEDGEIKILSG